MPQLNLTLFVFINSKKNHSRRRWIKPPEAMMPDTKPVSVQECIELVNKFQASEYSLKVPNPSDCRPLKLNHDLLKTITVVSGTQKEIKKMMEEIVFTKNKDGIAKRDIQTFMFSSDPKKRLQNIDTMKHHVKSWSSDQIARKTFKYVFLDCDDPPYLKTALWHSFTKNLCELQIALVCFTTLPEIAKERQCINNAWRPEDIPDWIKHDKLPEGFQKVTVKDIWSLIDV